MSETRRARNFAAQSILSRDTPFARSTLELTPVTHLDIGPSVPVTQSRLRVYHGWARSGTSTRPRTMQRFGGSMNMMRLGFHGFVLYIEITRI